MFMNESQFDEDGPSVKNTRKNFDRMEIHGGGSIESSGDFGSAGALPGSTGTRSKVLQQQRELQQKKMQDRLGGSGVIRSASPRNFSSPRNFDVDNKPSRFGFDEDDAGSRRDRRRNDDDDYDRKDRGRDRGRGRGSDRDYDRDDRSYRRSRDDDDDYDFRGSRRDRGREDRSDRDDRRERAWEKRERRGEKDRRRDDDDDDYRGSRRHKNRDYEDDDDYSRSSRTTNRGKRRDDDDDEDRRPSRRSERRRNDSDVSSDDDTSRLEKDLMSRGLSSTYDPNAKREQVKEELDLSDMRKFLTSPIPKAAEVVECYIERNRSGAMNRMYPEYTLYLKEGDRFLLTAKKRQKNKTSNYLISMQRGDLSRTSNNYLGKLRSNFVGTEYNIYDNGESEKKTGGVTRQELGCVMYAANVLGSRGPRKMRVYVPRVRDDGTRLVWRPMKKGEEMMAKCKEQDHTNLSYLINKPPRWNEQVGAYVLNFNGRVTMASVKNFQLVSPEDKETVVVQFGRVAKDLFTLDFRAPVGPLQAFAVALSSFDSKLACD